MRERDTRSERGFSLVEMVLYVSLFSLISVLSMNMLMQTMKSFTELRISRDINDSAVYVMERLTRDIRAATSVDMPNSTFDATPGRLTLNTVNASGTAMVVEYDVLSSQLHVKENGVDKGSLMSAKTKIDALIFNYVNTGSTAGVRIHLHLRSERGSVSTVDHFYNTILMRGMY